MVGDREKRRNVSLLASYGSQSPFRWSGSPLFGFLCLENKTLINKNKKNKTTHTQKTVSKVKINNVNGEDGRSE